MMSALCQKQTFCAAEGIPLFDDLAPAMGQKQTQPRLRDVRFAPKDIDTENQETSRRKIAPTCTAEFRGSRRGFSETKQSLGIAVIDHVAMR